MRSQTANKESLVLLLVAVILEMIFLLSPVRSPARELFHSGAAILDLGATYKNLFLGNRFYEIPGISDRTLFTDYQRARLMMGLKLFQRIALDVHYQHLTFINLTEEQMPLAGLQTVSDTGSLYRYTSLSWELEQTKDSQWLHEFDRLSVSLSLWKLDVILGRQAITWGTGRFWQPTDLFSPFGPLQVDREFKAGTDAARLLLALGDFTQAEFVWAFGRDADLDRSAGLLRYKTLIGSYDLSLLGGWVQGDSVGGGDFAGDLGTTGIGVHGEYLFNHIPNGSDYVQILLGIDYRFPGKGPYLLGEYYYNGAGAANPSDLDRALLDKRIISRGTFQLGGHYVGFGATYEIFPILQAAFYALVNPADPSAILNPSLEYSIADNATATVGITIPTGKTPTFLGPTSTFGTPDMHLNSEFGTYPLTVFVEVKFYTQ